MRFMNDRIFKVFISSPYSDLKYHRQRVIDTILKMQHLPVGMEMFNASSDVQWKVINDTIDDCDYYVLVLGKRYGSVMEKGSDIGMSYTEREFRYAMEQDVPCIGFLVSDEASIKAADMESDPQKLDKLNKFRKLVEENGTVNYWQNADELAEMVRSSLESEIKKHPRKGWVRFDSLNSIQQGMACDSEPIINRNSGLIMTTVTASAGDTIRIPQSGTDSRITSSDNCVINLVCDLTDDRPTRYTALGVYEGYVEVVIGEDIYNKTIGVEVRNY